MTLNATINQEAFLELPKLDASYSYLVTSRQTFEVSVNGNLLKVLSANEKINNQESNEELELLRDIRAIFRLRSN